MKSLAEIYQKYASPDPWGPGTGDKGTVHSYIELYESLFTPIRHSIRNFLEIGVLGGSSIRMWTEYFDKSTVYGIDIDERPLNGMFDLRPMLAEGFNLKFFDATIQSEIDRHLNGLKFDVVIDDASHMVSHQVETYRHLKPYLSENAVYVIEDIADIDSHRSIFENLDPSKKIQIHDRRKIKGRFDDVVAVLT